jgi:NADH:ubiquinone oxidoreductase subunit C
VIRVRLPRAHPTMPSLADVFPAADWNEREAMELFGIVFEGHPDPRKLLLPDDWEGFPLRKDYVYPSDHPYLRPDPRHELAGEEQE